MSTSREIRQQFIDYFVEKQAHTFVPSSPVVPHDDPTLLFTNAGMNQFKDVFLATGSRPYNRAANSQKCIRAGGKHNDLEDVGRDTYHHTFFEMLGNWSFGDYFKAEAIEWAWDLLTNVWGMDKSRLHATVFKGDEADGLEPDDEAAQLWKTVTDINPDHIHYCDKKDNFWEMGETGPCGPCSEIHVDLTPDASGGELVNADDRRVMEIWNLVFIQFNRDAGGHLTPLPAKHVDTGMGFERLCAVLQNKSSNYDTDVFAPIFDAIRQVTAARAYGGDLEDHVDIAYRVLADHIRMATFAITDGARPGNKKRDAVLRSVIRRAVRHGRQNFGVEKPYMFELVPSVVDSMGGAFPELKADPQLIADVIREEEEAFGKTIDRGMTRFSKLVDSSEGKVLDGAEVFHLYETYGFPPDLTRVMAEERGYSIDQKGFDAAQAEHENRSRGEKRRDLLPSLIDFVQQQNPPATEFVGYTDIQIKHPSFCLLFTEGDSSFDLAERVGAGDRVAMVTSTTPFYAEAGGQVGDTGRICTDSDGVFDVEDTIKVGEIYFHLGTVHAGSFTAVQPDGDSIDLSFTVDPVRRRKIMANHTSTHVMNHKLRDVLGEHVMQKGSLVDDARTRFDFSHNASLSVDELVQIEQMVNADIAADLPVHYGNAPQEDALKINGLRAVFGEKYPPVVRVVSIGASIGELLSDPDRDEWSGRSIEFCGGTHLDSTGDAESFVIVSEEAVAKGVRRLTAQTGQLAQQTQAEGDRLLARLDSLKGADADQLAAGLNELKHEFDGAMLPVVVRAKLRDGMAEVEKAVKKQQKEQNKAAAGDIVEKARAVADASNGSVIVAAIDGADGGSLRTAMDVIKKKRPDAAMLLGAATGDKCAFLAAVPKELIGKGLKAGDWVREVAQVAGGGGGGRPDMAQAGGKDPAKLDEALETGKQFAESKLS